MSNYVTNCLIILIQLIALEAIALSQRRKDCFASIKDPRVERIPLHQLGDILTIAILAVLAGGNGWEDMEV